MTHGLSAAQMQRAALPPEHEEAARMLLVLQGIVVQPLDVRSAAKALQRLRPAGKPPASCGAAS